MRVIWSYLYTIGVALSILLNAVLGGRPTETFCYRAVIARDQRRRWGCILCKLLDRVDPGHCDGALQWWREVNGRK